MVENKINVEDSYLPDIIDYCTKIDKISTESGITFEQGMKFLQNLYSKEDIIMKNPGYNNWSCIHRLERANFISKIRLFDMVTFSTITGLIEGKILMINKSGVDIRLNGRNKFIYWNRIKYVKRNIEEL